MHMSDALVSPVVAAVGGVAAVACLTVAIRKVKQADNPQSIPLMGVMGAFVFAAQMVNFAIPGTGSSGHIVGGVLLASVIGPWAAFITLSSVLVIQALFFADGGLLALGCNIMNMAATSCLIAYPLLFKRIVSNKISMGRIMWAAAITSVVGLELGAIGVTLETELSGITALPINQFLLFMVPIHLAIGLVEGVATGLTLFFLLKYKPELHSQYLLTPNRAVAPHRHRRLVVLFAVAAIAVGGFFSWFASSSPDGLEWSIGKVKGSEAEVSSTNRIYSYSQDLQDKSSFMPDYALKKDPNAAARQESEAEVRGQTSLAGLVGGIVVVALTFFAGLFLRVKKSKAS